MKKMKHLSVLVVVCCLVACQALGPQQEDDLVFDDAAEESSSSGLPEATSTVSSSQQQQPRKKWQRVEKLLGMADLVASVGHVFKIHVPKQAFSGSIDYYEAKGNNGKSLSHWLRWDEPAAALFGVPSRKDVGRHRVTIKAYGKYGDVAQDSFIIHVVPEKHEHFKHKDGKKRCREDQDRTMLTILIDARYDSLKPSAKVNALENLAGFLGLATSSLSIQPEPGKESSSSGVGSPVVLSGPGNVGRRREKHSSIIQWQVGCDGHFWPHQIDTIKLIPEQAKDGTLSEVTMLPVYQWRVRSETTEYARNRRDTAGSGDDLLPDEEDDEYDEGDYDDDEYDGNEGITESPQEPKQKPVIHPSGTIGGGTIVDEHPHRHHHGDNIAGIGAGLNTEDEFFWGNNNENLNNALFNSTAESTPTPITSPSTIAVTIPPTTSTTTTTTTTEPPTTPFSTTTVSTTSSTTTTTTTEQPPPSPTTESTTTSTTTTQAPSSGTIETLTSETSTPTLTNLTQVSGQSSPTSNVTTDSLTEDNEEPLTTEKEPFEEDVDEDETETDMTTTLQSNVFPAASESTVAASNGLSTTTTTTTSTTSGSVVEVAATAEPNATSTFSVNATADENTETPLPTREAPISPSSTFTLGTWSDNSTERVPGEPLDPYDSMNVPVYSSTPSTTTSTTTEATTTTTTTTTTPVPPTTPSTTTTTTTEPTTTPTTPEPTVPSTTPSTTTTTTTEPTTTTTTTQSTTTTTTERFDVYGSRNLRPQLDKRLKKLSIMQGKVLSYTIPDNTFSDPEDGNTKQLRLRLYEKGAPIKPTYWLQFNEATQEVYGLPLEDQYGNYLFEVVATDSEGETASDRLDIIVQQHKQSRAVNHEFHIYLKIEKRSEFPTNVDWELKVMRALAELYGDNDLSYITVRSIDIDHDQAIYTWTNDSLVRSSTCPQEDIDKLYQVLVSDEKSEEPSEGLIRVLGPEIKPKRVVYQGLEQCQQTKETQVNKYPVPRNQIDQLNATVGQLFVYTVPKDTFFDEEDGDTRSMKASLLTANRTEIPSTDWLQFDSSNQEFYGVPLKHDVGRKTYQLVVKDREGLEATDSLVAEVHPAPMVRHVVEISMTLNMAYESFVHSTLKKREFIQKLQKLYGDKNASAISLLSITGNRDTTTVTWRNLTLPTYHCPHDEITRLRRVLVNDNKSFTDELNREFNSNSQQPEFAVIQITVSQMGACQDFAVVGPYPDMPPVDDSTSVGASHDDYLITFVLPAIIIAAMLILAGIIACILYKRRRSGKMSVSEKDDERQSFRSKGIPVIFQDELDEKPDPGNKSPIILKEEKPPLPPPEYQRQEDGADIPMLAKENSEEPYQPPPPFATNRDNNRQNRPKPTPTYRKPPPYVPP